MSKIRRLPRVYLRTLRNPYVLIICLLYIITQVGNSIAISENFSQGLIIGMSNGLFGLFAYSLGFSSIYLLSEEPSSEDYFFDIDQDTALKSSLLLIGVQLFIMTGTIDHLQRTGYLAGTPIFSFVPGYDHLLYYLQRISYTSLPQMLPGLNPQMIQQTLLGWINFLIIPTIGLFLLGIRPRNIRSENRQIKAALPILGVYALGFIRGGISPGDLVFFLYVLLYPGLCEEFLYRGLMQPVFTRTTQHPLYGAALAVGFFAILQIPNYAFGIYSQSGIFAVGQLANSLFFGGLMAYGVYRTRTLWPWILIHALSNVAIWG